MSAEAGQRVGPRIAVIDYGAGNLVSIEQALTTVGAEVAIAREPDGLPDVDAIVARQAETLA